ncbi:Fic family protein [Embleya scabrispora]|uniref:Fic family protein n=1 Tax=Embleya scabrispora TaxID=159449 RepID=UPI002AA58038
MSGHDAQQRPWQHWAFLPSPLPSTPHLSQRTYKLAGDAQMAIGRLDFAVRRLPEPALLVRPALRREAISTSALEGTYAPVEEVFEAEFVDAQQQSAATREILNYVRAAERGLELIEKKPICLTLIAELQAILVKGTRGDSYDAGRLRQRQVYIGEQYGGIEQARFVPPPHGSHLENGVSDWEKWINAEDDIPLIAKTALAHYQFETLHPFSDGNGRLGRLIVVLMLTTAGALHYPVLNVSPWLERHREQYKDLLLHVSQTGDFDDWTQFFCQAVIDQAADTVARIEDLLTFRERVQSRLRTAKVKGVALGIADELIGYPFISPTQAANRHSVTYAAANTAVSKLVEHGLLREITGRSYGRLFACDEVITIILADGPAAS